MKAQRGEELFFSNPWCNIPYRARVSSLSRIHDQTQDKLHSVGLLWTTDRPDAETLDLTKHNTLTKQISMSLTGFEPVTPAIE